MTLMLPKREVLRDPAYLDYVRGLPCIITGQSPCDPHHLKMGWFTKGRKPPDDWVVPLIHSEHDKLHRMSDVAYWRDVFARDKQFVAEIMKLAARAMYLERGT